MEIPQRYDWKEAETRIQQFWEKEGIFRFDPEDMDREVYSVDTPPPTVSGKMHIGHAFSYSQQDVIVRYQRMKGFNVFYPFGTDDNGLATNILVEKENKVKASKMDRKTFGELCLKTLEKIRPQYIADWKRIGLSADFSVFYTTIDAHCQKISQRSFIELYKKGREYRKEAPMTICPQCQTAIAQVEMEDVEKETNLCHIRVQVETGDEIVFATTRPELLPACVGFSVHKDDKRYAHLIGKKVKLPLIDREVVISHDDSVDPEYGSGAVYFCTYGGIDCVEWLTRHPGVEPIHIMGIDGTYNEKAGKYAGMKSLEARKAVIADLESAGALVKLEKLKHAVNVHERCGTDIEYVATKQWFIKYLDLKEDMLTWGNELTWFPPHMKNRYDNWAKGLKWDWCISRQRSFGIPFPVWYSKKTGEVILADEDQLPVDPLVDVPSTLPAGHSADDIEPETDVLDTWATSSLTPHLAAELFKDKPIYDKLLPMDLRPQAHDIIAFWLFNTVIKSQLHEDRNPWKDVVISGWALDPHGRKMSKSKGNVVAPQEVLEKYPADALRFWAAGSKLGDDMPYQEKDLVTGLKTVNKLWNACKFCFMHLEKFDPSTAQATELTDKWLLAELNTLVAACTNHFDQYEYAHAKLATEKFFWQTFCDNYLEIVKDRLYNPDKRGEEAQRSAQYTVYYTMLTLLKLFAPVMPHITEELYQLYYGAAEEAKSIHVSTWPSAHSEGIDEDAIKAGALLLYAVEQARRAKSDQQKSLKTPVVRMVLQGKISQDLFSLVEADIKAAINCEDVEYKQLPAESDVDFAHDITL